SLAPSMTETLVDLGLADRLVGVDDYSTLPPDSRAQRVGSLNNPNLESLLRLEPDLVMSVEDAGDRTMSALRAHGVATFARDPQSLEAVFENVLEVGRRFGVEERAAACVAKLRDELSRVRAEVARRGTHPRVYVEVDYPPPFTIGRRSFVHDAL